MKAVVTVLTILGTVYSRRMVDTLHVRMPLLRLCAALTSAR